MKYTQTWFERLRELAETMVDDRTSKAAQENFEDIQKLFSEIQIYQAELEIQNEELKYAQGRLERSRTRLSLLFNMAPVGYIVLDDAGMIVDANQTILSMLGKERNALIQKPFSQFIMADDQALFWGRFRSFYKNPANKTIEVRLVRDDGSAFDARLEGRFIDLEGFPEIPYSEQFCLIVTDISENKRAEAALKKSEAEYRTLVNALPDAVISTDLEGNILFLNPFAETLFGCSAGEAMGTNLSRFCPADRISENREMFRQAGRHGTIPPYETERLTAAGRHIPVEMTLALRTDDTEQPCGFTAVIRDISERKRLDATLQSTERQLRLVLDSVPAQIWQKDLSGTYLQVNRAYCNALGTSEKIIVGKTDHNLFSPEIAAQNLAGDRRVLMSGVCEFGIEDRYQKGSGEYGWMRKDKLPYFDEAGNIAGTIGFAVDITEIKEAETRLRESESRFRSFVENANDLVYTIRPDGVFTYMSPNWRDFVGEPAEAAVGRSFEPYVHPEDVHLCREFLDRVLSTGEKQSSVEYRVQHRDGSWRWHFSTGSPLTDADGNVTGFLGIGRDITQRKATEEALRKNERYLRTILDTTADGFWVLDDRRRVVEVNAAYCGMMGYTRDEILGLTVTDLDADEVSEQTAARIERVITNGSERFETCHRRKDGSVFPVEVTTTWLQEEGGRFVCFGRDLTERKRQKDRIALLGRMLDEAPASITIHDTGGRFLYANRQAVQQHGYENEAAFLAVNLHDLDVPESEALLGERFRCIAEAGEARFEVAHYRKDGSTFPLEIVAKIIEWESRSAVLSIGSDITERKRAEEELRSRENLLQRIFEMLPIGLWFADKDGTLLRGNPAGVKIWGAEPHVPMSDYGIFKAWRLPSREPIAAQDWALAKTVLHGETIVDELLEIESFDGKRKTILNYTAPVMDNKGNIDGAIVINLDISDRQALDNQLRQAQKMESVGRLAGGVAHDFNNMLSVILGNTELAMDTVPPDNLLHDPLREIFNAARRSADITRQLLAFARKQTIAPRVIDINQTVKGMLKMLRRLIGENIELVWEPGEKIWPVKMDPSQIDQILANLCVNARDAITGVGRITIETGTASFSESDCADPLECIPGDFALLTVRDNGCGMDRQTLENLFEPFFTTKDVDKGTGLGLATVYGIVKQNNGFINVTSRPGKGAAFMIFLPRYKPPEKRIEKTISVKSDAQGSETVLLVEDEPGILKMTKMMLDRLGYSVLTAATPGEAIDLARHQDGEIHLLITDVVMPEMNGRELARQLLQLFPNIKRLFMSGYTADVIAHHGVLDEGVQYIQKPFSKKDLAVKVREVLGPSV